MQGYSRSKRDFRELLVSKYFTMSGEYTRQDPGCLTLPEDMMDARDFKAEEVIALDRSKPLPKSFSLGQWIYKTNYQNGRGSCTANATSHGAQVLNVKNS